MRAPQHWSTVRTVIEQAWQFLKRHWFTLLIAGGMVEAAIELIVRRNSSGAPTTALWITVPLLLIVPIPLFWWRRFPFGAPAAVFVIGSAVSFVDGRLLTFTLATFLTVLAAAFLFGQLEDRRQAVTGLAIAQARAERLEREQEAEARAAVAEERARIARELHDVVGHSVSVMTVQASAVRRRLNPDQEQEREALEIVEQTGREALAEMRRLVGVLRRPEEGPALAPQPSLQHLDRLVAQARESGLPVELRIEGEATQLPPGVDLTAYRLVQEGLTNAIKHARASKADVVVRYADGSVEVTVTDDGQGGGDGGGGGHGLVGMRERVTVYGGELEAGPRPEGGYSLRARLPVQG
jgi:signal transduction histidine kinase